LAPTSATIIDRHIQVINPITSRIGHGANFRSRFVTSALMPEFVLHNEITRLTRKLISSVVLPCAAPRRNYLIGFRLARTVTP
jgi:hypothetical protein